MNKETRQFIFALIALFICSAGFWLQLHEPDVISVSGILKLLLMLLGIVSGAVMLFRTL